MSWARAALRTHGFPKFQRACGNEPPASGVCVVQKSHDGTIPEWKIAPMRGGGSNVSLYFKFSGHKICIYGSLTRCKYICVFRDVSFFHKYYYFFSIMFQLCPVCFGLANWRFWFLLGGARAAARFLLAETCFHAAYPMTRLRDTVHILRSRGGGPRGRCDCPSLETESRKTSAGNVYDCLSSEVS